MLHAPFDTQRFETDRGTLEIWREARGVVVQRAKGYGTTQMAQLIVRNLERLIDNAEGPLLIFDDWEDLDGYTSEARIELTNWTADHVASVERIHILLRSKLVAMGISVANLATRGITEAYTDRRVFEMALTEAVRARHRRSLRPT